MLPPKELSALIEAISNPAEKYWKGVLYADFGKRKTTTALRCMNERALLQHTDRGWNVIFNHPDEFKVPENVMPIDYEGLAQTRALVEAIVENQEPFNNIDLFVVDTISQEQENYIDFLNDKFTIFGREKAIPRPEELKKDRTLKELEVTGLPDYHLVRNKMRPVIELLVRAPFNVMFLAHVRYPNFAEQAKGKIEKRPNITEAVWNVIARDATFIGFMEHSTREGFTIDFKPSKTVSAKSQIKSLTDQKIKADDLPKMLAEWQSN